MAILTFCILLSSAAFSLGLLTSAAKLVDGANELCLRTTPSALHESDAWRSMLCGQSVLESELREDLKQSSLLHLFVVSGSHLIWLDRVLRLLPLPTALRLLFWGAFVAMTGADPPVFRAAVGLLADIALRRLIPRWRSDQRVLFAGLCSLALQPTWYDSLSLSLSWAAALAMALPTKASWRGELLKATAAWIFLFPLLSQLGPSHPLGILVNVLFAPLVGGVLLPVAALAWIPGFEPLFDFSMMLFRQLLHILRQMPELPAMDWVLSPPLRWTWIFGLHLALHALLLFQRQGKDHSR